MAGFSAPLSGIRASFLGQSVAANNVANLDTPGFKSSRTLQASTGNENGTVVSELRTDSRQGPLIPTNRSKDVAIDGEGFFVVEKNGRRSYTRSGSFGLDGDGQLVNQATGGLVQGVEEGSVGSITVEAADRRMAPRATDSLSLQGNLSPSMKVGDTASVSVDLRNSRGTIQSTVLEFEKTGTNQFDLTARDPATGKQALEAELSFTSGGRVDSFDVAESPNAVGGFRGLVLKGDNGAESIRVGTSDLDLSNVTQQGGSTGLEPSEITGRPTGSLTSVSTSMSSVNCSPSLLRWRFSCVQISVVISARVQRLAGFSTSMPGVSQSEAMTESTPSTASSPRVSTS